MGLWAILMSQISYSLTGIGNARATPYSYNTTTGSVLVLVFWGVLKRSLSYWRLRGDWWIYKGLLSLYLAWQVIVVVLIRSSGLRLPVFCVLLSDIWVPLLARRMTWWTQCCAKGRSLQWSSTPWGSSEASAFILLVTTPKTFCLTFITPLMEYLWCQA